MLCYRNARNTRRWGGWPLAAAAIGAFFLSGATATAARADSNFERGFEDQMGRILAFEAVSLGKQVLFQGVAHSHQTAHYDRGYGDYRFTRYGDGYRHGKRVRWHHRRGDGPRHDHWKAYDYRRDFHRDRHRAEHRRHRRHDRHCRAHHAY